MLGRVSSKSWLSCGTAEMVRFAAWLDIHLMRLLQCLDLHYLPDEAIRTFRGCWYLGGQTRTQAFFAQIYLFFQSCNTYSKNPNKQIHENVIGMWFGAPGREMEAGTLPVRVPWSRCHQSIQGMNTSMYIWEPSKSCLINIRCCRKGLGKWD